MILEVCTATLESVIAAREGGAQRIELCSALSEDGLTPSYGMIKVAREVGPEFLHVLIRPRPGNFVYSDIEAACMIDDIKMCRSLGADGIVIGALTTENDIDIPLCRKLIDAAEGMQITFHRAFDVCRNPLHALEQIIDLGCHRILTSGQAPTALEGISLLKDLVTLSSGRISIMPGAGVNEDNARLILNATGATEIHGSLRSLTPNGMETDVAKVRATLNNFTTN